MLYVVGASPKEPHINSVSMPCTQYMYGGDGSGKTVMCVPQRPHCGSLCMLMSSMYIYIYICILQVTPPVAIYFLAVIR